MVENWISDEDIEIATFRSESENTTGNHQDIKMTFGVTLEEDLSRRDFTFNALYLGEDCKMYDYYKGHQHLQEKIIKMSFCRHFDTLNLNYLII